MSTFAEHYKYFEIDLSKIPSEFFSAKSILAQNKMLNPDLDLIVDTLKKLPNAFSETLKMLHLIKTLPVTTASNERFFSSLKRVKSYLRTTTGDERLSDLMVIEVQKHEASQIDLNKAVDKFAKMKNRRFPLN